MLEDIRVISRGRVAQLGEHLPGQQRVKAKSDSSYSFQFNEMARPGRLELPTLCLEGRRSIQLSYGRVAYCNYITELEASVHLPFGHDFCCAQFCAHPVLTSHLRPYLQMDGRNALKL